jgi:hypothetical protein
MQIVKCRNLMSIQGRDSQDRTYCTGGPLTPQWSISLLLKCARPTNDFCALRRARFKLLQEGTDDCKMELA